MDSHLVKTLLRGAWRGAVVGAGLMIVSYATRSMPGVFLPGFLAGMLALKSFGRPAAIGFWSAAVLSLLFYAALGAAIHSAIMYRGRRMPTDDLPRCAKCGYSLRGNVSGICPECGNPVSSRGDA